MIRNLIAPNSSDVKVVLNKSLYFSAQDNACLNTRFVGILRIECVVKVVIPQGYAIVHEVT